MPPKKQSVRTRAPPSDDEPEDLPTVAPDPKAIEVGDINPSLLRADLALTRKYCITKIQKRLDERVEKIRANYLTKVEGVKKRAKGRITTLSTKVYVTSIPRPGQSPGNQLTVLFFLPSSNHTRGKDLSKLVELLNQRQTTQSTIATKLTALERELNSLRRYFEAGYNVIEKRAAELPATSITHPDAGDEESKGNRGNMVDVS
ncbi:hypothetical protein PgNI_06247 [Pyricularia grisea]|uniref:Uncharacterized protein n=1 Tax=Pyricularia grisea TaxID=148305 RepID=A0A6P8B6P3_PYRGI|nr:hypothetical protein PgNI_06247 [Pyricularia grisea]TLD10794.1 hypothetical protein PgNI_06247 [Pyricularia grisea]